MIERKITMSKFVTTTDRETANKLEDEGFVLVNEKNGTWTFLNDSSVKFSHDIDKRKVTHTNTLYG